MTRERDLKDKKEASVEQLEAKVAELEGLIVKWERTNNLEVARMLLLPREVLKMGQALLTALRKDPG